MRKLRPAANRMSAVRTASVKAVSTALAVIATACGGGGESTPAVKESQPVVAAGPPGNKPVICTWPSEGLSAPAGPLVIGGNITGRPGNPSFIYVGEGEGRDPILVYGPDFAKSPTITGFIVAGLNSRTCYGEDPTTYNGRETGLHLEQPVYLQVSATIGPSSLSGSLRDKAGTYALTAGSISGSSYDMSAPATVASAEGSWTLADMRGSPVSIVVDSAGNVTGNYGCPFTGVLSPSPESVNLLRVQLSIAECAKGPTFALPYHGFALVMPLISGGSQLLIWVENDAWDLVYVLAMGRR